MTGVIQPSTLAALAQWISRRMGLADCAQKPADLIRALSRAAADANALSPQAFASDLLREAGTNPKAIFRIAPYLTVGETYFFRDASLYQALENIVLPDGLTAAQGRPLRLWSAACSSGEEPYSLAIALWRMGAGVGHRILATDVNPQALAAARAHTYRDWSLRGMDPRQRAQWFVAMSDGRWRLRSDLAAEVQFELHNLLDPDLPAAADEGLFDVILCRNVLIYLEPWAAQRVIERLLSQLADGGWLFVAAVETFLVSSPQAEMITLGETLAFRKRGGADPLPTSFRHFPNVQAWPGGAAAYPVEATWGAASLAEPAPAAAPSTFCNSAASRPAGAMPTGAVPAASGASCPAPSVAAAASTTVRLPALRPVTRRLKRSQVERHPISVKLVGPFDPASLYQLGLAAERDGDWPQAATTWRKILFLDPQHLLAQVALARVQRQAGRSTDAARSLRQALQLAAAWPDSAPVADGGGLTVAALRQQIRDQLAALERDV